MLSVVSTRHVSSTPSGLASLPSSFPSDAQHRETAKDIRKKIKANIARAAHRLEWPLDVSPSLSEYSVEYMGR